MSQPMSEISSTFLFCGQQHAVGVKCTAGLCGEKGTPFTQAYPIPCKCGGSIHGHFTPALVNATFFGPEETCDRCGGHLDPEISGSP